MTLPPALAAVAAAQRGPFTTAQALDAGLEQREIARLVRSGQWQRLRRGVLIDSSALPDDDRGRTILAVRGLALRVHTPTIASHHTAAVLHQLPLLRPPDDVLNVTRPGTDNGRIEAGVHWHCGAVRDEDVVDVDGIPCTSVARTVIDLARESAFADGLVAAEAALNRGLVAAADLRAAHEFCLDWRGARTAGRVVSFASQLSESPGESLARIAFAEQGLPDPEQQREIFDRLGFIGRVDFLWAAHRTIGEFDGRSKYTGDGGRNVLYDEKRREDRLRAAGFEVVRFSWADVLGRPGWLADEIRAAFARATHRLPASAS